MGFSAESIIEPSDSNARESESRLSKDEDMLLLVEICLC